MKRLFLISEEQTVQLDFGILTTTFGSKAWSTDLFMIMLQLVRAHAYKGLSRLAVFLRGQAVCKLPLWQNMFSSLC